MTSLPNVRLWLVLVTSTVCVGCASAPPPVASEPHVVATPSATAPAASAGDNANKAPDNLATTAHQPMPDAIGKFRLGAAATALNHLGQPRGSGELVDYGVTPQKETFFGYPLQSMGLQFTRGVMTRIEVDLRDPGKCDALIADVTKKWGPSPVMPLLQWTFDDGGTITVVNGSPRSCTVRIMRA